MLDLKKDDVYGSFRDGLLPGNYALTKSMEFTKVNTCGTLWYLKKFLVLYNTIFLSGDSVKYNVYVDRVRDIFDDFVSSLDASVRSKAEAFFFPEEHSGAINFRSGNFRKFNEFKGTKSFDDAKQEKEWENTAKKYYFIFLMNIGGQSGVKAHIKEKLYSAGFDLTMLEDTIKEYWDANPDSKKTSTTTDVINDFHAALRNERQIMYYYGFFHSKSTGANDSEFSSITPVGDLAIKANFMELLCIWEMQKLKMISQPVTAKIKDIPAVAGDGDFKIGYTPYLNILRYLKRYSSMSLEDYKFFVSRINRDYEDRDVFESLCTQAEKKTKELKGKVMAYKRAGDANDEDGAKELKKYILGLRGDLKNDSGTNPLACIALKDGKSASVTDSSRLDKILEAYQTLSDYKTDKYKELFDSCNEELAKSYKGEAGKTHYDIDPKTKIRWDMYNIRQEETMLLALAVVAASVAKALDISSGKKNIKALQDSMDDMPNICASLGLKAKGARNRAVRDILQALKNKDLKGYASHDAPSAKDYTDKYREESTDALFVKIKDLSRQLSTASDKARERNAGLIGMLRSYYIQKYADAEDSLLHCECCREKTFMTASGIPYVEFHHLVPFSEYSGPDHYLNLFALCPNCHRKIHYLPVARKDEIYNGISKNNYNETSLVERLKELKKENVLCSYHLEFLLADKAITEDEYNSIAA